MSRNRFEVPQEKKNTKSNVMNYNCILFVCSACMWAVHRSSLCSSVCSEVVCCLIFSDILNNLLWIPSSDLIIILKYYSEMETDIK